MQTQPRRVAEAERLCAAVAASAAGVGAAGGVLMEAALLSSRLHRSGNSHPRPLALEPQEAAAPPPSPSAWWLPCSRWVLLPSWLTARPAVPRARRGQLRRRQRLQVQLGGQTAQGARAVSRGRLQPPQAPRWAPLTWPCCHWRHSQTRPGAATWLCAAREGATQDRLRSRLAAPARPGRHSHGVPTSSTAAEAAQRATGSAWWGAFRACPQERLPGAAALTAGCHPRPVKPGL